MRTRGTEARHVHAHDFIPLRRRVLAVALVLLLGGCDVLTAPPVPDWPGPHAPYPFPDNIPHRTE
ncbi:hypothetical protein [Burkholderia cepacia]|uniref:hypothetical protein n=1 Tax=Burkholderia cepacia TaxID=292 RepID=UPI000770C2FA|nr:hypothetical protein [Burkholderia cepacia]KVS75998.1 hypothetical protein WK41_07570 [Burkholderia cepacia]